MRRMLFRVLTFRVKRPELSLSVPLRVPFSRMLAPASGRPRSLRTVPRAVAAWFAVAPGGFCCCAYSNAGAGQRIRARRYIW